MTADRELDRIELGDRVADALNSAPATVPPAIEVVGIDELGEAA